MDTAPFNPFKKTNANPKYILALLAVFLIGAAAGALIFYRLNSEILVPKITLAGFEKKFQEKIKNGNLSFLTFPQPEYASQPVGSLSGVIAKIEASSSFIVKVKNFYKDGDIIDFVLTQPDFYEIRILIDESSKISDIVFAPPSANSGGLRVVGILVPQERALTFGDLKEGQEVNVFLEKKINLSEAADAKASSVRILQSSIMPPTQD